MYKSFLCRFASFHPLSEKRGEVSNISATRCGHKRRPSWYFNYWEFRWSPDFIKTGLCPWRALTTPGNFFGKVWHRFWWSLLPNRSISHEKPWFPKGDVLIQTPVVGDFIVWPHKNFHGRQSPLYHGFDFLTHFRFRLLYLRHFLNLMCNLWI